MKTVHVVAALIRSGGKVLATQRGYGEYRGGWEFPGGKVESGETPEQALVREIQEELGVKIRVVSYLDTIEYDYPLFHLSMRCYWAEIEEGKPVLFEHEAAKWLGKGDLDSVEWLPADLTILDAVRKNL
jgi:8-oxo-dGTP diphosphatase